MQDVLGFDLISSTARKSKVSCFVQRIAKTCKLYSAYSLTLKIKRLMKLIYMKRFKPEYLILIKLFSHASVSWCREAKWMNGKRNFRLMFLECARKLRSERWKNVKFTRINITFWSFIAVINMLNCNNRAAWHENFSSSLEVFFHVDKWARKLLHRRGISITTVGFNYFHRWYATLKAMFVSFLRKTWNLCRNIKIYRN